MISAVFLFSASYIDGVQAYDNKILPDNFKTNREPIVTFASNFAGQFASRVLCCGLRFCGLKFWVLLGSYFRRASVFKTDCASRACVERDIHFSFSASIASPLDKSNDKP